ncbi:VOC family protein [Peribacillus simplex]|nr:VOC family protein [Peribacillus simplex]WHY55236.1 VOC family protein [Peribacillus simplex]
MTANTHIGLAVPDLDATIKWYEQVSGFKFVPHFSNSIKKCL